MKILNIALTVWREVVRRKDLYVLLILLGALLVLLATLDVFGLGAVACYVKDVGLLGAWICGWILAVTVSARQLPAEEKHGTIFALLAKPVTRAHLILGKWLGAWSAVSLGVLAFYLLVLAVTWAKGGGAPPVAFLQGFILHAAALGMICALAIACSTRLHSDAASTLCFVVSAAAFVVVPRVPEFLALDVRPASAALLLWLYNVLPHLEILDLRTLIVHDYPAAPAAGVFLALLYAAAWTALLLGLAWWSYHRKSFSRAGLYV